MRRARVGNLGGEVRYNRRRHFGVTEMCLKLYLRELGHALIEASESSNPRVLDLALDLVERPALRFRRLRPLPPPVIDVKTGAFTRRKFAIWAIPDRPEGFRQPVRLKLEAA